MTLKRLEGPEAGDRARTSSGRRSTARTRPCSARGFAVRRRDVESDQPKDTVVAQSPDAGTYQPPGSTITLSVSKGPTTSTVPDVTSIAQSDAVAQLNASGFEVRIVSQPVTDPDQDGIVQTQDPAGGTKAPPGSTVTIAVGKFSSTTSPTGPP